MEEGAFLERLSGAVNRIHEYKEVLGIDSQPTRKYKLQGAVSSDIKIDLAKHFARHDPRAEAAAEER